MMDLCATCSKSRDCTDPFPHYECENYEQRITSKYVWELFQGMGPSMQKSIIEIMKVTQRKDK